MYVDTALRPHSSPIKDILSAWLSRLGVPDNIDYSSASIRTKKDGTLGTPLSVTVDLHTVADGLLMMRERYGTSQVRGSEDDVILAVEGMVDAPANFHGYLRAISRDGLFEGG